MQNLLRVLSPLSRWRLRMLLDRGGVRYRGRLTASTLRRRERAQKRQHWLERYQWPKERAAKAAAARKKRLDPKLYGFSDEGNDGAQGSLKLPPVQRYAGLYERLQGTRVANRSEDAAVGLRIVSDEAGQVAASSRSMLSLERDRSPKQHDRGSITIQDAMQIARQARLLFEQSAQKNGSSASLSKALDLGRSLLRVQKLLRSDPSSAPLVQAFIHEFGMGEVLATVARVSMTNAGRVTLVPPLHEARIQPKRIPTSTTVVVGNQRHEHDPDAGVEQPYPTGSTAVSPVASAQNLGRMLALAVMRSFATFTSGQDLAFQTAAEPMSMWSPYLAFLERPSAEQAEALVRVDLNSLGSYTVLMQSLSSARCDQAVVAVFDMLLARKGYALDVLTCNVAMRALANLGNVERVVQLLRTMLQSGSGQTSSNEAAASMQPEWYTWRCAIRACLQRRNIEAAWTMYKQATMHMNRAAAESPMKTTTAMVQPPLALQLQMADALTQKGHVSALLQMLETSERTMGTSAVNDPAVALQQQLEDTDASTKQERWSAILAGHVVLAVRKAALRVAWDQSKATSFASLGNHANESIAELETILNRLQDRYLISMQHQYRARQRWLRGGASKAPYARSSTRSAIDKIPPEEHFIQARCALRQEDQVRVFLQSYGTLHLSPNDQGNATINPPLHERTLLAMLEMAAARADITLARELNALLEKQTIQKSTRGAAMIYMATALARSGNWREAWSRIQQIPGFDPAGKARDQECLRCLLDACEESSTRKHILDTLGVADRRVDHRLSV
jgi:pentatricopeptide repeat protein